MNDTSVVIRFALLIRPDAQGLITSLVQYARWQPENMSRIPITVEWPTEIRDRLDYLSRLLDGRIPWPPTVSEPARQQTQDLVHKTIPTIEDEIIAGVHLILTVGNIGDASRGELSCSETTSLLDLYVSSKTMALVRLLLAFRFTYPSGQQWQEVHADPNWMRAYHDLHVNWGYDVIDGLPYVIHDRGDEVLYWTDADAYETGVISGGTLYRIYVPGILDLMNSINPMARENFLKYLAPQVVERLIRSKSGGADLAGWARTPGAWRLTMRHESFIDLITFYQVPWSNFRFRNAKPDGQEIHQDVFRRLRNLVDKKLLGSGATERRFEELKGRFAFRFPLSYSAVKVNPIIVKVLTEARRALSIGDIEARVREDAMGKEADTFDIRDAVSELVAGGKVEFEHPGYKVKLKKESDPSEQMTSEPKSVASGEPTP
ncbi:MAG: hypothetical protein ACRELG_15930 [Gemmataceae bacterium]